MRTMNCTLPAPASSCSGRASLGAAQQQSHSYATPAAGVLLLLRLPLLNLCWRVGMQRSSPYQDCARTWWTRIGAWRMAVQAVCAGCTPPSGRIKRHATPIQQQHSAARL